MTRRDRGPFAELGLEPGVVAGLEALGLERPLPVQAAAIPAILGGKDLVCSARTGSGKTLAYLAPLSSLLLSTSANLRRAGTQVLVLVPTRELALQVKQVAARLGRATGIEAFAIHGGVKYEAQTRALKRGVTILVATPGRMRDHVVRGNARFATVGAVVLDEADRMLEMGFVEDVRFLLEELPDERVTLLFSATIDERVERLAQAFTRRPVRVRSGQEGGPEDGAPPMPPGLRHLATVVRQPHKRLLLVHLLRDPSWERVLVFARTRHRAGALADVLRAAGVSAAALHADLTQAERNDALQRFRDGRLQALAATDVAERGLDLPEVTHVLNFDLPGRPATYLHRVGRTARVEGTGTAVTFVTPPEERRIAQLAHRLGLAIETVVFPGFDYDQRVEGHDPLVEPPPSAPRRRASGRRDAGPGPGGPSGGPTPTRPGRGGRAAREEFWQRVRGRRKRGRG